MTQHTKNVKTIFPSDEAGNDYFDLIADGILQTAQALQSTYWEKHAEVSNVSYDSSTRQMQDAQRLGQLSEVICLLRQAQGTLRCINSVNVKGN
jgi:hypothetical protein